MFSSLRDDLMARTEAKAAAREAAAKKACVEAQEALTEELEERLRKHWPRKGRTEVCRQTCAWCAQGCLGKTRREQQEIRDMYDASLAKSSGRLNGYTRYFGVP